MTKPPGKTAMLITRVTPARRELVRAVAHERGMRLSEFIRAAVDAYIRLGTDRGAA